MDVATNFNFETKKVINSKFVFILDDLKTLILAQCGIPCCQQILSGWPENKYPINKDALSKFNFPEKFKLYLTTGRTTSNQDRNGRYYKNI